MARIHIQHVDGTSWYFELSGTFVVTLGRSPDNPIVLDDPTIGRRHAVITSDGDGFWIVDGGSYNGTRINGVRVQRDQLFDGDQISIGRYTITFFGPQSAAPRRTPTIEVAASPVFGLPGSGKLSPPDNAASLDPGPGREVGGSESSAPNRTDVNTGALPTPPPNFDHGSTRAKSVDREPEGRRSSASREHVAPAPMEVLRRFETEPPSLGRPRVAASREEPSASETSGFAPPPPYRPPGAPVAPISPSRRETTNTYHLPLPTSARVQASPPAYRESRLEPVGALRGTSIRPSNPIVDAFAQNSPGFEREQIRARGVQKPSWWRRVWSGDWRTKRDLVDCSVFAPPRVQRDQGFMVQAFAHCPAQAGRVAAMAKEFDESALRRGKKTLAAELPRGTSLAFHLSLPGFEIIEAVQQLRWLGEPESVQFEVRVPSKFRETTALGRVTIASDGVPLGHISIKFEVVGTAASNVKDHKLAGDSAYAYRKAFISYASSDRAEVLKRVQMLSRLGIDYFQDLLSFEPGDRWERELYRHIDESDLFLLFWSNAARESKWVREEVRYALARKGGEDDLPPAIVPVIIEGPPPAPPPDELAHLHFNDYMVYFFQQ